MQMRLLYIHLHNSPSNQERTNIVLRVFCLFARQSGTSLACKLFRAGMHPFVSGGSLLWAQIFPKISGQSCSTIWNVLNWLCVNKAATGSSTLLLLPLLSTDPEEMGRKTEQSSRKVNGKGNSHHRWGGGVSPALFREDTGCGLLRWICHRRAVPELCSWDGSFALHPQNKEQVLNILPGLGMRGHQEAEKLVLWNTSKEWSLSHEPRSCASPTITQL